MSLTSLLKQVDKLKAEFEALQPLKKEDEERLWKKFRLDWNYNSNHIEGNTLTYGETELLLIFGKTTGDHTIREYEEMQAHDVAIKLVQEEAVEKEKPLTEQFIRLLNEKLLVKPFWKEAQTAGGQPTRRLIVPGEYKKHPNSVLLENGEMFHYANPQEVPILMGDLVADYNKAVADGKHPIDIAAMLHYRFVRIHPFDDGNGRVARLLMNYVLLRNGYLPAIIKTEYKKEYLAALNKTDVINSEVSNINNVSPFTEYIAEQLLWSSDIALKAAKGKSIVEVGDFEKVIKNIVQKTNNNKDINYIKDDIGVEFFFDNIFKLFLITFYNKSAALRNLFLQFDYQIQLFDEFGYIYNYNIKNVNNRVSFSKLTDALVNGIEDLNVKFLNLYEEMTLSDFDGFNRRNSSISSINIFISFLNFKKNGKNVFSLDIPVVFALNKVNYTFTAYADEVEIKFEKMYDEIITDSELDQLLFNIADNIKNNLT